MAVTRKRPSGERARRRRTRNTRLFFTRHCSQDIAHLWMSRLLVELEGWRNLYSNVPITEDDILRPLGLDDLVEEWGVVSGEYNIGIGRRLLPYLEDRLEQYLRHAPTLGHTLSGNLDNLAERIGLSETERSLLAFAVIHDTYRPLTECTASFSDLRSDQALKMLEVALNLPGEDIRAAMAPGGLLQTAGLLVLERSLSANSFAEHFTLLSGLAGRLLETHSDPMASLRPYFHGAAPGTLNADDFVHIGEDLDTSRRYLREAVRRRLIGSNVLFYGIPGTGKTELAKALAEALGFELMEIAVADEDGDPLNGKQRLGAYQFCQSVLSDKKSTLVLFDEVEDVFDPAVSALFGRAYSGGVGKGRINQILEQNPVPAIWICNSIDAFDEAFLRRFDVVVEFTTPPRSIRRSILSEQLAGLNVSQSWIDRIAARPEIPPALITRAAKVAAIVNDRGQSKTEKRLENLLAGTLKAMGHDADLGANTQRSLTYRLDIVNPDCDLEPVVAGVRRVGRARLCLYGAPGVGKSEFVRHLAETSGRPLLVKRASDLLSPFIGEAEQNIAQMFQQAEEDDAVLLLDEADSFLRDRRGARHSWEVTQVNEMLTRMERFDGVFVCATNLLDDLDEASARRFDLKIRFDWMKPEQVWALFRQVIKEHQGRLPLPSSPWRDKLRQLSNLTPGDFATVVRKSRIMGEALTAERLFKGLGEEIRFKKHGAGRSIGFTAAI
jgi:transitional endoplasmic reticulum ATPase